MECQKELFDLPHDVSYLNTAYMSPITKVASVKGQEGVEKKLRPYLISSEEFFSPSRELKKSFASLIDHDNYEDIAIIPSVSYGIANVCANIDFVQGDEIVVVKDQFPSNIYSWMEVAQNLGVKVIEIDSPNSEDNKGHLWNQALLEAIGERTKVVSIPQVHWSEGVIFNLKEIREKTDLIGAYLIIDGTQSIGAYPLSIKEINPDAIICGGYKWMMGTYGMGLAYFGKRFLDGRPIEHNWINRLGSEDFSKLVDYQEKFMPGANRYCSGESSNFIAIPVLKYGIEQLIKWNPGRIQSFCKNILSNHIDSLSEFGYQSCTADQRANHLFGIKVPTNIDINHLSQKLSREKIIVSIRKNYIRVSPFVFNTEEDIRRFCEVLVKEVN